MEDIVNGFILPPQPHNNHPAKFKGTSTIFENTFEKAVELIRNQEKCLRTISNEGTMNSVQGATNGHPKLPPCDVCGKNLHSSAKSLKNPNRQAWEGVAIAEVVTENQEMMHRQLKWQKSQ
jgi:hypothetical protein